MGEDRIGGAANADLELARELLRVRLSMMRINDLIKQQAFSVPIHLALGHEAIAVAVAAVMEPADRLLLTHRNIHYNLARNPDLGSEIAEYRLSEQGLGGGRYGAMNLTNPARGIAYTSSILGNCLVVAVGIAKARKLATPQAVTIAVTGDGAMEEGAFYEALMMARSLELPVIFLVENNQWSMYTRIHERRCAVGLRGMAAAFEIPFHALDGCDAVECRARLSAARRIAIEQSSPCIVEVELSTLGDRHVEEPGRAPRYINYHHGAVGWVEYADDPVIERSDRDPLHRLARQLDSSGWTELVSEAREQLAAVVA